MSVTNSDFKDKNLARGFGGAFSRTRLFAPYNSGQFGLMDDTDSGKEIEVLWSGRRGKEEIVFHRFSVPDLLPEK